MKMIGVSALLLICARRRLRRARHTPLNMWR